ncbi:hypothetical protein P4233_20015 [Pseudomonas aeruginosa]|nr:hypothetical protein [Pseudomonas aeruginosa]
MELPGRGARMAEPLQTDLASLAQQLASCTTRSASSSSVAGHSLALARLRGAGVRLASGRLRRSMPLGFFACGTAALSRTRRV